MAFFAVVKDSDDGFDVLQCHINLWCLGGILGHNNFVWDVGVRLKGTSNKAVSKLQMAFPFGTKDGEIEDLHDKLCHSHTAELVFGGPVSIINDQIDYGDGPVTLGRIDNPKRLLDKCGAEYSFWEMNLAPTLTIDRETYVRVRVRIACCSNTWVWKRSLWRKNGALVDLRVSDVREAVSVGTWGALKDRIVPIQKLNMLVIAPDFLQMRAVSPPLRYMRLLESRAWENYLGQSPNFSNRRRLIIYHWRSQEPRIDITRPFLAFLDLSRDYGFIRTENHFRSAVLIVLVAGITQRYGAEVTGALAPLIPWRIAITGFGGVTMLWFLVRHWNRLEDLSRWFTGRFLAIERWFLRASRNN